ncbi:MAG TPA: S8 family peptidase [Bryobacteraceae bacterium]|nr:S8 family peptidase [Bryobacteraceae bacterium]
MTQHERIRAELARNPLAEPLFTDVQRAPEKVHSAMIDANVEYHLGRDAAFEAIVRLAQQAQQSVPPENPLEAAPIELPRSIGSHANPYMRARLHGYVLREMVRLDAEQARQLAEAAKLQDQSRRQKGETEANLPPLDPRRYLAIYRIWRNFEVNPLIDKSVSTVKADAARRAFLAEGRDIVWAVIDSGIDKQHEHFRDNDNLAVKLPVAHWDFTLPDGAKAENSALVDEFGHGTHIAGIIAGGLTQAREGRNPQAMRSRIDAAQNVSEEVSDIRQICGIAPCTKLVSMKVLSGTGQGDISRVIEAIDRIQQINDYGRQLLIHGVNLSLGYEFDPRWFACGQSPICVEINRLVQSGVVVVVAAGNTGYGTLESMQRQTGSGLMLTINDPGNSEQAITVGSTHRDMPHTYGVSYFSSKGPTGDGRSKPDLVAPGERILSCASSTLPSSEGRMDRYREDSGTSQAAAHVSGVIAAFLSIRREFIGKPAEVKKLFVSTATDLGRERYAQGLGLVDLMRAIQSV